MHRRISLSLAVTAWIATASTARADVFDVTAASGTTTVRSGSSSLIGLTENLANTTDQFAPLKNQTFTSGLTYAGISNAIQLNQSFDATGNRVINLRIPSTGVNQTFSSANGSLADQIRDYLKKDGLADLTAFQAVIGKQSAAGVVDGNPLAADALMADAGYQQFALHVSPFDTDGARFESSGGHVVNRYWAEGGVSNAGGISGQYVNLTLATEFHFNDVLGLSFTSPFRFQTLHSADVFMGGEMVGLPVTIIPAKGNPISWQVTPAGHAALVGSQDLVSGGLIYGGQVDSSLSCSVNGFTLTLADEAGYFRGTNVDIAGYDFNTRLDQWVFKNGVQLQKNWGNFLLDASATWTNFLRDTYVDGYFTPEVGIGFKFGKKNNCGVRVGYTGNFGNGYNTSGGNVLLYFGQ